MRRFVPQIIHFGDRDRVAVKTQRRADLTFHRLSRLFSFAFRRAGTGHRISSAAHRFCVLRRILACLKGSAIGNFGGAVAFRRTADSILCTHV